LQALADKHNLQLFFDSAHAFGCRVNDKHIGGFGAVEVFSFHATKVFSSAEGGCLTTNDDELAKRLRNVRSSYGAGPPVSVVKTSNGRMSEAQAAIALLSLDKFSSILARNNELFDLYRRGLAEIEGLRLVEPQNVSQSNYQYVVVEIEEASFGLSRDALLEVLKGENIIARRYFYPGIHRTIPYASGDGEVAHLPNTERLNQCILQLPIGALVSNDDVQKICGILRLIRDCVTDVKAALGS
jgi:dTDP-4-amino-4,6-dideoxygalactose transaminase